MVASLEQEMVAFKPHPGHIACTMSPAAHGAMTMSTPFTGQKTFKTNGATEATAFNVLGLIHVKALNSSPGM
jgi:hypothetical protein